SSDQAENLRSIMPDTDPDLLAVESIMIPLPHRHCAKRSEIRTRFGFGEALHPIVLSRQNSRKPFFLLRHRPEPADHRSDQVKAAQRKGRCKGIRGLFLKNIAFQWSPAASAHL